MTDVRESGLGAVVIVPTYNEIDNLPIIIPDIRATVADAHILIVDDHSPDGTGALADEMAAADAHVFVMHRAAKSGLGDAYLAAFEWALARDYSVIVEMDADGSHPADALPALIATVRPGSRYGLGIGSRWAAGGSVINWSWHRELLSRGGNLYARIMLGLNVKDATAGFRAFAADTLRNIHLENVESHGYCFQIDMTRRVRDAGYEETEVPIVFREREHGESKMSGSIVREAMGKVTMWGFARIFGRSR
jgi:dolichol-phosphate mannosyltransferase